MNITKHLSKSVLIVFCVHFCHLGYSQDLDGLFRALDTAKSDSVRYELNVEIGYQLLGPNADSARLFFKPAIRLARKLDEGSKIARSLTLTGLTYYFSGQFDEAIRYYLEALPISESIGSDRYAGIISNNIGAVYFEMKDLQSTRTYYEKALSHFKVAQDTFWLSNTLNNLGNLLEKEKEYESSIDIYQESLSLAYATDNQEAIGSALSNLGNVYMAMGQYGKAMEQYSRGITVQKEIGDKIGQAISLNNIGQIFTKTGNIDRGILKHKESLQLASEITHLETIKNANKWLAESYAKTGLYEKAFDHQKEFMILKDSLTGLEKTNAIEELNQKYEYEKNQRIITQLELEKQNSELVLTRSKNQRNIFISGFILVIGLAAFLYHRIRTKRRNETILEDKNKKIAVALEDRETLLKEIHHRVKNNLQIISSLLNLQAGYLKDDAAIDAVKEGQNRVKSMALIHQNLYLNDHLSGIPVNEYFLNLTDALYQSYGVDREKIVPRIDVEQLKLDIDTLIPLGLIVNELVSNALKYAFPAGQGNLNINFQKVDDTLKLKIRDNGEGFDISKMENSESYGWKMIRSLSRKLKADISIKNKNGTEIFMEIRNFKLVA